MDLAYNLELSVRYGEVGYNGVATLTSLANWLQEAAGLSADSLGFGEKDLAEHDLTWILTRLVLRIRRMPEAGEEIIVRSWPSNRDRFAHRGYEIVDRDNNLLLSGGSAWSIMDMKNRKMHPLPEKLAQNYPQSLSPCDAFICRVLPKTADESPWQGQARLIVRKDDLDLNRHVNNARYLSWLLEALPFAPEKTQMPAMLDIGFRAECFPAEELLSICQVKPEALPFEPQDLDLAGPQPVFMIHSIQRTGEKNEEVCRALTVWRDLEL